MRFVRGFLLSALSFVLILVLTTAALGFSAKILLQPDIYKNALEKAGAYGFLGSQGNSSAVPIPIKGTVRENVDRILENGFAYLRGERDEPGIYIDIDGLKIRDFFITKATEFPVCKSGQPPYDGNDIKCRPSEIPVEKFLEDVLDKRNASQFLSAADGKYDLLQTFDKDRNIVKAKGYVSTFNLALNIFIIGSLAICVLIFFVSGSMKSSLRWTGFSFIVSGLIVFSIPYAAKMAIQIIVEKASQAIGFLNIDPLDLVSPLINSIESKASFLLLFGAVCFAMSFIQFLQKFTIGKDKNNRKL